MDGFGDKFMFGALKVTPILLVSYGVGLGVEFIFCMVKGHSIQEGYLVSGMLIPLIVPIDIPLWILAVAVVFAVVIGKEVFGGTGMNILNVALTCRAFLFFAYPTMMSGNEVWVIVPEDEKGKMEIAHYQAPESGDLDTYTYTGDVIASNGAVIGSVENGILKSGVDGYTGATPLGELASTISFEQEIRKKKEAIQYAENDEAVSKINSEIEALKHKQDVAVSKKPKIKTLLMGDYLGSIGETSFAAILLGALILMITGIGSWKIMFSMVVGGLAMGALFNVIGANPFMSEMNPVDHVLLGGFMFGTVFMATDPVTAAQTSMGKWIYGFLAGFLGIMVRVFNPAYPEGIMMAILFMNVMAPLIDHYVIQSNIKKRLKRLKTAQ
jgi:Na+-transporting NADH:ubiquinone oxidoreductase subunit B